MFYFSIHTLFLESDLSSCISVEMQLYRVEYRDCFDICEVGFLCLSVYLEEPVICKSLRVKQARENKSNHQAEVKRCTGGDVYILICVFICCF